MSKLIPGNQKHLTLQDRLFIEESLDAGVSFKDIAKYLCKDPTTISKEIRAHRLSVWRDHGLFVNMKNFCVRRYSCRKTNACGKLILCGVRCASCLPVTYAVRTLNEKNAAVLTALHTFAMDAQSGIPPPSATSHRNIAMMPGSRKGSTKNFSPMLVSVFIARAKNCTRSTKSFPHLLHKGSLRTRS